MQYRLAYWEVVTLQNASWEESRNPIMKHANIPMQLDIILPVPMPSMSAHNQILTSESVTNSVTAIIWGITVGEGQGRRGKKGPYTYITIL